MADPVLCAAVPDGLAVKELLGGANECATTVAGGIGSWLELCSAGSAIGPEDIVISVPLVLVLERSNLSIAQSLYG